MAIKGSIVSSKISKSKALAKKAQANLKKRNKKDKVVEIKLKSTKKSPQAKQKLSEIKSKQTLAETFENPSVKDLAIFKKTKKKQAKKKLSKEFLYNAKKNAKSYTLDLRLHSSYSKTFFKVDGVHSIDAMMRLAKVKGIDIVSISDYNSFESYNEAIEAAKDHKLKIFPAIDLRFRFGSCDDCFFTAIFSEKKTKEELDNLLVSLKISKKSFGDPSFVIPVEFGEALKVIEKSGGILIPSRLDQSPRQQLVIKNLVNDFGFRAFDLVSEDSLEFFKQNWPEGGFTFFNFSNADSLGQVGSRSSKVKLCKPGFDGLTQRASRNL